MLDLQDYIIHPEQLDGRSLEEFRCLVKQYPYFQMVRLLYLKNLHVMHDPTFDEELGHSVMYITSRTFLYHYINGEVKSVHDENKVSSGNTLEGNRTLAIIDAYLASMPEESTYAAIGSGIATDYASYLMKCDDTSGENEAEVSPMRGQDLIDTFIEKAGEGQAFHRAGSRYDESGTVEVGDLNEEEDKEVDIDDDSYFTETLAKIYIKQQRYAKAIEIIKKLSLKYPKKSTYFADQIKELEELIINAKSKK